MIDHSSSTTKPGRVPLIAGAVALTAAMFAVGFWLGGTRSSPDSQDAGNEDADQGRPVPMVGRLEDLLPALEAKVAANPRDINQRILLGRTYVEVGQRDKGIQAFRALRKDAPDNPEVVILLATTLVEGGKPAELREVQGLLDHAVRLKPAVAPMARLYQGEALARLGDRQGAKKIWTAALRLMPAGDPSRSLYEQRLAGLESR